MAREAKTESNRPIRAYIARMRELTESVAMRNRKIHSRNSPNGRVVYKDRASGTTRQQQP